jgi:basic membrane protein A
MLIAAAALVLAGCGSDNNDPSSEGSESPGAGEGVCDGSDGDGPKVGIAYDVGGRGDLSFNDSAYEGVAKAVDELGATCQEAEAGAGENDADREERLRLLADAGFNPILAIGFVYSPAVGKVAAEYPAVDFAVVDGYVTFLTGDMVPVENATDLNFAANEGSFLVGAAAALKTKTKTVGFLGGVNGPLIQAFEAGFKAGVKEVDPKIKILTEYLSQDDPVKGFENPGDGKTVGAGMYDDGADIVYHAAGKSGLGLFDAVVEAGEGKWAIGVDSDQYLTADDAQKPHILTSMLKRVDVGIFEYLEAFAADTVEGGVVNYDLKSQGVGYSTSGGFVDDIKPKLDDYSQQIVDGEIKVPSTP